MHIWTETPSADDRRLLDHTSDYRLRLVAAAAEPDPEPDPDEVWWSVLVVLEDASIDMFIAATAEFAQDLLVPVAYDARDRVQIRARQPVTVYARADLIDLMNRPDNGFYVSALYLGAIAPDRTLDFDATAPDLTPVNVAPDTVVVAVIDDGIAIAHDLLRQAPTRTRVAHVTLFDADPVPTGHSSVGRALESGVIDRLLAKCTSNGLLDEQRFYRCAGVVDWTARAVSPVARRTSHGTFVAGVAAGAAMDTGCTNRPVICAALPARLVEDTTGRDSLPLLYLAFHILAKQAQRFCDPEGRPVPVVFNFSFGNTGGPHDGTGLFAELFEYYFGPDRTLSTAPDGDPECMSTSAGQKAWLMLPAGNDNLGRLHGVAQDAGSTRLDLTIQPDDHTPTEVQIWLPTGTSEAPPALIDVQVTTPWGQTGAISSRPGQSVTLVDANGAEVARLSCQYPTGLTERAMVVLSTHPTASRDGTPPLAPAGNWTLEITRPDETCASDPPVHVWIRRDETLPGTRSGGRQAWFSNPDYQRFDRFGAPLPVDPPDTPSPVRRASTLSGFAGGATPVVVAAYTERGAQLSDYSAAGPLNPRGRAPEVPRDGPDLAAKGDDSRLLRGVIGAGSNSGSWVRLSGTSVSCPRVARRAADDIRDWSGDARDWSHWAVSQSPFPLKGDPEETRAGAGGIDIPL